MDMMLKVDVVEQLGQPMIRFAIGQNAAVLYANEIEDLLAWIARCRSGILPPVTERPRDGVVFAAENDPQWQLKRDPINDSVVLMLRHSGFGWLGFLMSEENITLLDHAIRDSHQPSYCVEPTRLN